MTRRLNVRGRGGTPLGCTHRPLICLIRTTSSVYCRVVSVRSTRGLGVLAARRAGRLLLSCFSGRHRTRQLGAVRVMDSAGRRVTCLHSDIVKLLVNRYIRTFMSGRRGVLGKRFRKDLVGRVSRMPTGTCGRYTSVSLGGVCHSHSILSVRLTNFHVVDALLRLVVSTIYSPRGTCSRLLVGHMSNRCGVGTPTLCREVRTMLSCVSKVASMFTLSLCEGVGKGDLPTMWRAADVLPSDPVVRPCLLPAWTYAAPIHSL